MLTMNDKKAQPNDKQSLLDANGYEVYNRGGYRFNSGCREGDPL
ncbi:hypothetical protein JOE21_002310 [Desmospora profundinema]|uniref:Uncharacterized protein n=1 Tax=Desmospora profundinema TaxID=1571184 RepID=A0ABU1IQU0_9BACL|nr:hypothetical protein [Desmospora profundinema]